MADQPTVLIVDDDFDARQIYSSCLDKVGLPHEEAKNGVEALAQLESSNFSIIILDLQMPEMDGIATLRRMRVSQEHQNTTVIVISANAQMAGDEVHSLADYVMLKPLDIVTFMQFMERFKVT